MHKPTHLKIGEGRCQWGRVGVLSPRARKRFGQHFLRDPEIIQRIITAIQPSSDQHLVEIGPGLGALTVPLLAAAGSLDAVELDSQLIGPLSARCHGRGTLRVRHADALKFEFCSLAVPGVRLRIVGNLPYNISTPLLFHLLRQLDCIEDMHFMLQKEVVDRLTAGPGGKSYGRLSVMVQLRCAVSRLFTIGSAAFSPRPRVESAFICLVPHRQSLVKIQDDHALARIVAQAFSRRRKTLRNALRKLLSEEQIRAAGVDPALRPERLSLQQFASLSNRLARRAENTENRSEVKS
jgi:dimethyladenosine transferase